MNTQSIPIIVKETYNTTIENLWKTITEADLMRQWFFEQIETFQPEVGFETHFNVQVEDRNFHHLWKITEVVPLKKITYSWKYKGYPGDGFVTFELSEHDNGSALKLTATGMETFPQDIPEFTRESCFGGWNYFIKERLKAFIDQ